MKAIIARLWPYYSLCTKRFCFRGMGYQGRCWKHVREVLIDE